MRSSISKSLSDIASYYSDKLAEHADTSLGVDWNSEESQRIRFAQLCKVIDHKISNFSINVLGCGYGALLNYMRDQGSECSYLGIDISDTMIKSSKIRHANDNNARFLVSDEPDEVADYGLASGIFNVRLERKDSEWFDYLQASLDILDKTSSRGFAFNCLTSYSDIDKRHEYLYYSDPCCLFELCKQRYSRQVALLHDYGLYEFTILVRKNV